MTTGEGEKLRRQIRQREASPIPRFSTGFGMLDYSSRGGIHGGRLVTIGGTTGAGKTTFALNIALNVAEHARVGIVPIEMGDEDTRETLAAMLHETSRDSFVSDLTSGVPAFEEMARATLDKLSALKLSIARTSPDEEVSVERCFGWAAAKKLDVLVIDYAQDLQGWGQGRVEGKYMPDEIVLAVRRKTSSMKIATLLVAQLNREADPRKPPRKEQLAGSALLERKADAVWLVHRPQLGKDSEDNIIELILDKNRLGPIRSIPFHYKPAIGTVRGMTHGESEVYFNSRKRSQAPAGSDHGDE